MTLLFKPKAAYEILAVTGVQTCALPISLDRHRLRPRRADPGRHHRPRTCGRGGGQPAERIETDSRRSEERRVGKEWRSRWSPYHYKKQWSLKGDAVTAHK